MSSSIYDLVSLSAAPGSTVRVLELASGTPGNPLRGSLVLCPLDGGKGPLPYTALSYTWGKRKVRDAATGQWGKQTTTIQLQGATSPVEVWPELKHAMDALRESDKPVRLWIDALCIKQSDNSEKNHQLPLMGDIYARASKTIIWLGCASDDSDLAMRCIQNIGSEYRRLGKLPPATWFETSFQGADWDAIAALMARPWWGRVWIIQEVLKSRNSVLRCGGATAPLGDFVVIEAFRRAFARQVHGVNQILSYPLNNVLSAWDLNRRDANSDECPLFDWLGITHRFAYTQKRDRFYALRSLATPGAREAIAAEYDRTKLSDALLNVKANIHVLTVEQQTLLPLQFAWRKRTRGLPTWCPDWYTQQEGYVPFVFDSGAVAATGEDGEKPPPRLTFQACGSLHTLADISFDPAGKALTNETAGRCSFHISGWPFDEIVFCDAFPDINLAQETTPQLQAAGRAARRRALYRKCAAWRRVVEQHIQDNHQSNPYGSPDALRAAFWRTLIADRDGDWGGPPPDDFGEGLDRFLDSAGQDVQGSMAFLVPAVSRLARRTFIITKMGYLGLAPMRCREGDLVCVLTGGEVPFVLRPDKGPHWREDDDGKGGGWVGEVYATEVGRRGVCAWDHARGMDLGAGKGTEAAL
ncbi:heterokaryon incompatibility protein [Apiospora aurea]|uniref:Heterokaryon incompatibility protein n=1 Tax=Apiospora aurea TaxID=335848 RepID=A0ABR1PYU3_9PEZI